MGTIKYLPKIKEFIKKTPIFSARDVELLVGSKDYAHLLLHNLFEKGEIYRLTKGCYSQRSDPILLVACLKPAYLGLQEALSFHNLWEQETNPVILTPRQVREGVRSVLGNNVLVRHLPAQYFFGFDFLPYDDFSLPVSDVEKTLIDLVYFKLTFAPETLKEIKERIQLTKLDSYLQHYPQEFQNLVQQIMKSGGNSNKTVQ
jgi:predicted transcriptional regulator of viral defense system